MEEQTTLDKIKDITQAVVTGLGVQVQSLSVNWQDEQERVYASLDVGDMNGFLIGKDGRMLEALKLIVEAAVSRSENRSVEFYLDVGGYWNRMEKEALEEAQRICEEVRSTGRSHPLEPMHALLRRFIHRALITEIGIRTESEGEGAWKSIIIHPKRS